MLNVSIQEHDKKRGENYGDPLDLDNQITPMPTSPEDKKTSTTPYGTITNGDPKPPSPEGIYCVTLQKNVVRIL